MRGIAGICRGRALASVGKGDAGAHLRPTTDRVRESLFSMLQGGRFNDPITDARVLDLFAGTGALGIEALSRGAATATFVDDGRVAGRLIRDNLTRCDLAGRAQLIARDARRLPPCASEPFTLVFLDPPYGTDLGLRALDTAIRGQWIAPNALVVFEDDRAQSAPPGFTLLDQRRFGGTYVSFMKWSALPASE